jgi:hypothetical protein
MAFGLKSIVALLAHDFSNSHVGDNSMKDFAPRMGFCTSQLWPRTLLGQAVLLLALPTYPRWPQVAALQPTLQGR